MAAQLVSSEGFIGCSIGAKREADRLLNWGQVGGFSAARLGPNVELIGLSIGSERGAGAPLNWGQEGGLLGRSVGPKRGLSVAQLDLGGGSFGLSIRTDWETDRSLNWEFDLLGECFQSATK